MYTVYSGEENQRTKNKFKFRKELKKNSEEDEPDDIKIGEDSIEDKIDDESDVIKTTKQKRESFFLRYH